MLRDDLCRVKHCCSRKIPANEQDLLTAEITADSIPHKRTLVVGGSKALLLPGSSTSRTHDSYLFVTQRARTHGSRDFS